MQHCPTLTTPVGQCSVQVWCSHQTFLQHSLNIPIVLVDVWSRWTIWPPLSQHCRCIYIDLDYFECLSNIVDCSVGLFDPPPLPYPPLVTQHHRTSLYDVRLCSPSETVSPFDFLNLSQVRKGKVHIYIYNHKNYNFLEFDWSINLCIL